jgi:hypothetical protein
MAVGKVNRKQRKELARQLWSANPGLEVVHPRAAGIDVGNTAHYVAVRPEMDAEPVRRFECFTADLHRLADWLEACGVETVAMQSTGVYWIPLYEILEERGLEVYLVNARHTKNLPGRKSDVQESQWLLKLHTHGLLNNSFQPPAGIRVVRTYWRQRGEHVRGASTCVQRMQKVLTQMNVQLANVISDLSGLTGQTIVRAILAGERDPRNLAELSHPQIRATREEIVKSLEGNWRPELLFVLKQEMEMYDTYQRKIAECDRELQSHLKQFADKVGRSAPAVTSTEQPKVSQAKKAKRSQGNAPAFNLSSEFESNQRSGPDSNRWGQRDRGADGHQRSGVGYEPMENRGALRLVVRIVSRQPRQRGQSAKERYAARDQPCGYGIAAGGNDPDPESQLPGRAIPTFANQTGSAQGDYGHGSPARPIGLPDDEVRP